MPPKSGASKPTVPRHSLSKKLQETMRTHSSTVRLQNPSLLRSWKPLSQLVRVRGNYFASSRSNSMRDGPRGTHRELRTSCIEMVLRLSVNGETAAQFDFNGVRLREQPGPRALQSELDSGILEGDILSPSVHWMDSDIVPGTLPANRAQIMADSARPRYGDSSANWDFQE